MLARVPYRYPISTLDIEGQDVMLTVGDQEVVGRLRMTNTGKQRFQVLQPQCRSKFEDLPRTALVSLWRPLDDMIWPQELPEPAIMTPEPETRVDRTERVRDGDFEGESTHTSHIYLGRPGERPQSVLEVEHRIIRGLRTAAVIEREIISQDVLWPRPWLDEVKIRQKQLDVQVGRNRDPVMKGWREQDYADYFVDRSALNARPVRFEPTPRDVSDYEARTHFKWLQLIPAYDRWLFDARAKLPPLDWWQIADQERVEEHIIQERYKHALEMIFKRLLRR